MTLDATVLMVRAPSVTSMTCTPCRKLSGIGSSAKCQGRMMLG
jgi:hypothetical protein